MISDSLQRLQDSNARIKSNVANAYGKCEEMGATLPSVQNSENLAGTIDSIEQNADGWKPDPDWWDIDKILAEDTEDYPAKMIILLTDGLDEMTFKMNATNKIAKIKTSDGAEYTETATHNWNASKDKECYLGYKTRYYIVYFSDTSAAVNYDDLPLANNFSILYMILKNLQLTVGATISYQSWLQNHIYLENIKFINSTLTELNGYLLRGNSFLSEIDMSKVFITNKALNCFLSCENLRDMRGLNIREDMTVNLESMFRDCKCIKTIDVDIPLTTSFNMLFFSCAKLQRIKSLDFINATVISNMFSGCTRLIEITDVSNIKISGINLKDCIRLNHDTLIRFIDALQDFSDDTEGTHMITFGSTNLAKLTEEELAIGQNKGWTIS